MGEEGRVGVAGRTAEAQSIMVGLVETVEVLVPVEVTALVREPVREPWGRVSPSPQPPRAERRS